MRPIQAGERAPAIPGLQLEDGRGIVMFYKVTCPTCQMVAPVAQRLFERFPGRFAAVAQDPPDRIQDFGRHFGSSFPSLSEPPPYDAANGYGVRSVPTLFVVDGGSVVDVVES
ncbi:MAG TPA: redoxin domain-containing protein, partial [Actinomycetota bacterium]|nr:redoxin domain-containing protein [Actinomycetota bacterium]